MECGLSALIPLGLGGELLDEGMAVEVVVGLGFAFDHVLFG